MKNQYCFEKFSVSGYISVESVKHGVIFMPIFRYTCKKCGANFELLLRRFDSEAKCPECGSVDLEKALNRFAAVTKNTSGCPAKFDCPSAGGCGCAGGCCGHKH